MVTENVCVGLILKLIRAVSSHVALASESSPYIFTECLLDFQNEPT